ncbi:hypothetical protein K440DRAFT_18785 [Wilcoxina mikolae CBS 423.85]|nr:hypothetical protein K440DRAFT_18785 [Wilcoxina mikolae CBS 423.85]
MLSMGMMIIRSDVATFLPLILSLESFLHSCFLMLLSGSHGRSVVPHLRVGYKFGCHSIHAAHF